MVYLRLVQLKNKGDIWSAEAVHIEAQQMKTKHHPNMVDQTFFLINSIT